MPIKTLNCLIYRSAPPPPGALQEALEYLTASEDAFNRGLYNVTGLLAQISAELAVNATISFLGYTFPETHEIRKLLSLLYDLTKDESVADFVKSRRGDLVLLEDARQRGQYFSYGLDREDAEACLNTAKDVIDLVKRVWGEKWCSG